MIGALIVYRIGCFIPVPGVNPEAMLQLMEAQEGTIVDMFNMFSGGALQRFSLFALNVMPYISASIIVQLLVQILPSLEGDAEGRRVRAAARSPSTRAWARCRWRWCRRGHRDGAAEPGAPSGMPVVYNPGMGFVLTAVVALTAGTMFLMWLGEQVTERGIGNGVSLIIFAGIVAGLPGAVLDTLEQARNGDMSALHGDRDRG